MAKYKVVIQIYKTFEVEADNVPDAKAKAEHELKALKILEEKDRFNVNEPAMPKAKKIEKK